jgi:membrane protein implicated in regulation of membrane protease activity
MRGALAAGGTAVAAALCCLAIPLTAGIIGLSDLAAFGANLGAAAIIASALIVAWIIWSRSHRKAEASGDGDG